MTGARMRRTSKRPLPAGRMMPIEALVFGAGAAGAGLLYLTMAVNELSGLTTALTAFDMGVPFNELNRVLDLGFKRLPWGDKGFVPSTMQNVGEEAGAAAPNGKPERSHVSSKFDSIGRALEWFEGKQRLNSKG